MDGNSSKLNAEYLLYLKVALIVVLIEVLTADLTPTVLYPELSSYPVCSTPSPKHQGATERTSGDSEDCEAPRGICGRAGRTCQPSQFRPSSLPMRGWC